MWTFFLAQVLDYLLDTDYVFSRFAIVIILLIMWPILHCFIHVSTFCSGHCSLYYHICIPTSIYTTRGSYHDNYKITILYNIVLPIIHVYVLNISMLSITQIMQQINMSNVRYVLQDILTALSFFCTYYIYYYNLVVLIFNYAFKFKGVHQSIINLLSIIAMTIYYGNPHIYFCI